MSSAVVEITESKGDETEVVGRAAFEQLLRHRFRGITFQREKGMELAHDSFL